MMRINTSSSRACIAPTINSAARSALIPAAPIPTSARSHLGTLSLTQGRHSLAALWRCP